MDLDAILENIKALQLEIKKTIHHLIIIGPTGAGKSAIANAVIQNNDLKFQRQQGSRCFLPKTNSRFLVSTDHTQSMTSIPQPCQINEKITVWDLPGFGDNRSIENDIHTTILSSILLSKCQSLIMLLIPHSQFNTDKAQKLVETLNMMTDENANIVLVISKADPALTVKYIKNFLLNCIGNDQADGNQTRLSQISKKLLGKIIDHDLILMFKQPIKTNEEGVFQFSQENICEMHKVIFKEELYQKTSVQLKFSPKSQEYVDFIEKNLLQKIYLLEQSLLAKYVAISLRFFKFQSNKDLQKEYDIEFKEYTILIKEFSEISNLLNFNNYQSEIENKIKELSDIITNVAYQNLDQRLYISSLQYSSAQLMNKIKEYQQQSISIQEIHIISTISFIVDEDLILPGVNVHITTQQFNVIKQSVINLKGQKGQPFEKAMLQNNQLPHSYQGRSGQNGGSLQLQAKECHNIDLLNVNLSGGDGGNGQDGADGKDGVDGKDADMDKVKRKDLSCYVKYEELPISWAQKKLTFNRTFHCQFINKGEIGSCGGNSREGGDGGDKGKKGIIQTNLGQGINIIFNESKKGCMGKNGKAGKGGEQGKNYIGVLKVIKTFGIINKPENLEQNHDNTGEGIMGNSVTTVVGTAGGAFGAGVGRFCLAEVATQTINVGSRFGVKAVVEGCVAGITWGTVVWALAGTVAIQGAFSIGQILLGDSGEWISQHQERSSIFASSGNVLKNTNIRYLQEQDNQEEIFKMGIINQRNFFIETVNKAKEFYKFDCLSSQILLEYQQIPK